MKVFMKFLWIQWKMDLREKGTLMNYYVIPLLFYVVIGSVFSKVNPDTKGTLAETMIIFAVTMGTIVGMPGPLVKLRETGAIRAFSVNGLSAGKVILVHAISAFFHTFVVAMIITLTSPLFFDSDKVAYPLGFLAVLLVLILTSTSLGILIGVAAANASFATTFSQLIFLPSLLLSGIMFQDSLLPNLLLLIGRLLPATYAMQAFTGLAFHYTTEINGWLAFSVLLGIGIVAMGLSIYRMDKSVREEVI